MSQFTSTLIDDESLIEELKRYGEKNLPLLSSSTVSSSGSKKSSSSRAVRLNDSNREIYLKKLNHYKAKEKAKLNPSKQYVKQRKSVLVTNGSAGSHSSASSNNNNNHASRYDDDDDDDIKREATDDIIEIDANNETTSEYVRMNNAATSPLSDSITDYQSAAPSSSSSTYFSRPSLFSSTQIDHTEGTHKKLGNSSDKKHN
jgi:hypothetical protein